MEHSQDYCVATNNSMLQHIAQQAKGIKEEKSIATKEFPITTEIAKDSKKFCHDRKNFVATEWIG